MGRKRSSNCGQPGQFKKHATASTSTVGGFDEAADRPWNYPDRRSYSFVPGGPAPSRRAVGYASSRGRIPGLPDRAAASSADQLEQLLLVQAFGGFRALQEFGGADAQPAGLATTSAAVRANSKHPPAASMLVQDSLVSPRLISAATKRPRTPGLRQQAWRKSRVAGRVW